MLRFFAPVSIGIEVTSSAVRFGVISRSGKGTAVHATRAFDLPAGIVTETYALPVLSDAKQFADALRAGLLGFSAFKTRRIGLSLPDAMFRIQILEFDELPGAASDREKLIRWRLEKSAAFDMTGTVLRFQAQKRTERGHVVLAAAAKQDLIASFEDLLADLGFEVWNIIPSSLSVLNFYAPYLAAGSGLYALVLLSGGSYSTIIVDNGIPRFYRYREIKAAGREDVVGRLARELDDSLHFFTHRDRIQPSEVGHLSVAGEPGIIERLSEALKSSTTAEVERLSPSAVIPSLNDDQGIFAAALGAGGMQ